jgi:NTE family protein/lysophospholipid hydrolase
MTDLVAPHVLDAARIAADLKSVDAFTGFEPGVFAEIASVASEIQLDADEPFVRQGDPGDALFVLLSGSFEVVLELETGGRQTLARLSAGDCVGELALLTGQSRAATVIARTAATALRISSDALELVFERHPDARRRLLAFASRRLPSLRLASSGLFVGVGADALSRFDRESNWVRIPGDQILFRQGDAADDMYVVVHGGLEVVVTNPNGATRVVDVLGPGASIGEMSLLSDEPRSATVRAIRDSELVRIAKPEFLALLEEHPRTAIELSRTLVRRLRETTAAPRIRRFARTIAILPSQAAGIAPEFTTRLADSLAALGDSVLRLSAAKVDVELGDGTSSTSLADVANGRLLSWLNEREQRARYVLYECDATLTPWTERCLRQADLILAVANAQADPEPGSVERAGLDSPSGNDDVPRRCELVLLHPPAAVRPAGTIRWLRARARPSLRVTHHHVRLDRAGDVGRLARSIAGASLGIALSGGGARGFAQIGVMRALGELGLEIDSVGGTSMGSVLGGLCAMNHDVATIVEMARKGFVGFNAASDVTVPTVSLLRGGSMTRMCKAMFGDAQIEDLWIPHFAVSTNLSRAEVVAHDEGPMWKWISASGAVPGIAPPIPHEGDLLVDGGVLNNLPVDILRARCRGSVIAVDVSAPVDLRTRADLTATEMSGWSQLARALNPFSRSESFPNILQILTRAATLSSAHNQDRMKDLADLYLHPPTDDLPLFNWKAIDQIVEIGYRYSYDLIQRWMGSDARHTGVHTAVRRTGSWGV